MNREPYSRVIAEDHSKDKRRKKPCCCTNEAHVDQIAFAYGGIAANLNVQSNACGNNVDIDVNVEIEDDGYDETDAVEAETDYGLSHVDGHQDKKKKKKCCCNNEAKVFQKAIAYDDGSYSPDIAVNANIQKNRCNNKLDVDVDVEVEDDSSDYTLAFEGLNLPQQAQGAPEQFQVNLNGQPVKPEKVVTEKVNGKFVIRLKTP